MAFARHVSNLYLRKECLQDFLSLCRKEGWLTREVVLPKNCKSQEDKLVAEVLYRSAWKSIYKNDRLHPKTYRLEVGLSPVYMTYMIQLSAEEKQ